MSNEKLSNEALNPPLREAGVIGCPSFDEWVEKYFKTPKMKMMYERKDGEGEYDKAELIRMYNRAFGK